MGHISYFFALTCKLCDMKIGCYILYSRNLDRYYIGATRDGIENRLRKHLSQFYGRSSYTAKASDWKVFLEISTKTYSHALRLEKKIKSMKSSKYIRNLKQYPELIEKVLCETK